MTGMIVALLLALPLGTPFGEATATATSVNDGLRLDVFVEVQGSPVAVVVRGVGTGAAELEPVALADRGDGVWQGIVELQVIDNILMGFEFIPERGPVTMSEMHPLTEYGVDSAVFSMDNPTTAFGESADDPLVSPEGARWGWMGLAAGAGAIALIAIWAIGSVRSGKEPEDESPVVVDVEIELIED